MRKIIFVCLLVTTLQAAAQRVFQHPGCLVGTQELAAMRQHVTQKEEPFYSEWKKLLADSRCSTTWNAHNPVEDIGGSDGTR